MIKVKYIRMLCFTFMFSFVSLSMLTVSSAQDNDLIDKLKQHGMAEGYLELSALPDSLALVPPAPEKGSARQGLDDGISAKALGLQSTSRFALAKQDADLTFPTAANTYSCALGVHINEDKTPNIYNVMQRTLTDAGLSTYAAKNEYQRQRPFMINDAAICTPDDEKGLRGDGSYPSGHTAAGWAWALILAEIAPERADILFARGKAFGDSRIICNVHWQNDVFMGRMMGAATVALLHSNKEFLSDIKSAKAEYLAASHDIDLNCASEKEALSYKLQ